MSPSLRLPAEWEPQDGVLIAWPHRGTDWAPYLKSAEKVFAGIATEVSRRERVLIAAASVADLRAKLRRAGAVMRNVDVWEIPLNDTWSRDFGPITVFRGRRPILLDFGFNGWGLKFPADRDNRITSRLHRSGAFGRTAIVRPGLILEGGSIESDGEGTILTTSECILSPNRNPHLTKKEIEKEFCRWLGARRVLWLDHGALTGDDTDSHIDTLARFCPNDTIAYVACPDRRDTHFASLEKMRRQLEKFRTRAGRPYRLLPLPMAAPRFDEEGGRLPATYANFLVINGAVLVPFYNDLARDREARRILAFAFPGREIVGIPCLPLILQHGSLHCVTMQIPKGVLS